MGHFNKILIKLLRRTKDNKKESQVNLNSNRFSENLVFTDLIYVYNIFLKATTLFGVVVAVGC